MSEVPHHPFLLCTRDQFPELQARAAEEPWKGMKARALEISKGELPEFKSPRDLQKYMGAVGLAYILEPAQQERHAQRVKEVILEGLSQVDFDPEKAWMGVVSPMGAAFTSILALDIVYNSLSAEEVEACEKMILQQISKIPRQGSWPAARMGTFGTWEIYKGIRKGSDDAYYHRYTEQMTDDGVSTVSPGYAYARLGAGDDRPQKSAYADVLEFTGLDNRYYQDERLKKFYRFLFSAAVTPAKQNYLFGDVGPGWGRGSSALLWRVGRFDAEAAGYAAWLLEGQEAPGHLLPYLLMQEALPEPVVPTSQLFFEGAAVLREPADSPLSFGAMLYNITQRDEWHTHEEVNGISLAAYGERVLVNGGWLGDPTRAPDKNNTISINGQRHKSKTGAGLVEGLMSSGFDYACGDSGKALEEDHFFRNLMLIHGSEDTPGYFVVYDEVNAAPGDKVHLYLQPASEQKAEEISIGQQYRSTLDHHTKQADVSLDVLYVTRADEVKQDLIASGELKRDPKSGKHYRLQALFDVDPQGKKKLLTLLIPRLKGKPEVQNIHLPEGIEAVQLTFPNGVRDTLLIGNPEHLIPLDELLFQGDFLYLREKSGELASYFMKNGTRFAYRKKSLHMDAQPVTVFQQTGAESVEVITR